jgi:endonuclease I
MRKSKFLIAQAAAMAALALATPALAQYEVPNPIYAAPGSYYSTATGTGVTLKNQLNEIIDNHTVYTYSSSAHDAAMLKIDEDPNNSNNVTLIYSGVSVAKSAVLNTTYNREHMWPNSYGLDDTNAAYSDLWNLRICDANVNSDRNNNYYDDGGVVGNPEAPDTREVEGVSWEPRPIEKGDIARSMFYMDTRYQGDANDGFPRDLVLVGTSQLGNITTSNSNMGNLDTLLKWNYQDGVSNAERRRNHLIYTSDTGPNGWNGTARNQGNRNPFIDHPEWVWTVFSGSSSNNSKIYVSALAPGNGTSTSTATLRVMKNGTWGSSNVTMSKVGANPTTYDVTTTGNATTTAAGVGQTLDYNALQRTLSVSLNAATGTTGLKTGTIVIDNTDIAPSSAAGEGLNDGNDTITVNGSVVDNRSITTTAAAFGRVLIGANVTTGTTLDSPGADSSNTRVTVKAAASAADANGAFITTGVDQTFNGTLITAIRTVQANFASTGSKAGARSFTVQGEGLTGEVVAGVSVSYSATAVDHSNASFTAVTNSDAQAIDFGYVPSGFAARTASFDIYNLASGSGALLTASLDVDSAASGGSTQVTTNIAPMTVAAGVSPLNFIATYTPTTAGAVNNTQTIAVSDENIPGATNNAVSPVLTSTAYTVTAATFPNTGFMKLFANETFNTGAFQIAANRTLSMTGPGVMNVNGAQSNGSNSTLAVSAGTVNISTDSGSNAAAPLAVQVGGTGSATFSAQQHLRALTVDAADASTTASIATDSLSIINGGQVDLTDKSLAIRNGDAGTWNGTYSGAQGLVDSGSNNGLWNGTGLITSMPAALNLTTTLGVAKASDVLSIAPGGTTTWTGLEVSENDVLVRYTYSGDANLDGTINADDYALIDLYSQTPGASDYNRGDFNYDGSINADDYALIDNGASQNFPPLGSRNSLVSSGLTAVPEPASIALIALAAPLLARRRRRGAARVI